MGEKYGVELFKKVAVALAEVLSILYVFFVKKGGLLSLWGIQKPAAVFVSLDFAKFKLEAGDLSEAERESVEGDFKAALHPDLQAKVGSGVDLLEEGIDLVEEGVAFGKDVYAKGLAFFESGKALLAKAKALFGV